VGAGHNYRGDSAWITLLRGHAPATPSHVAHT